MTVKYEAGTLNFTPTCSLELLKKQKGFMGQYLNCLEIRAEIEGIDLHNKAQLPEVARHWGRKHLAEVWGAFLMVSKRRYAFCMGSVTTFPKFYIDRTLKSLKAYGISETNTIEKIGRTNHYV